MQEQSERNDVLSLDPRLVLTKADPERLSNTINVKIIVMELFDALKSLNIFGDKYSTNLIVTRKKIRSDIVTRDRRFLIAIKLALEKLQNNLLTIGNYYNQSMLIGGTDNKHRGEAVLRNT